MKSLDLEKLLLSFETSAASFAFDLQYFAPSAEEEGRTEQPTEHKKRKAKEKGQVAKSQELVGIIVFMAGFWTVSLLVNMTIQNLMQLLRYYFVLFAEVKTTTEVLSPIYAEILLLLLKTVIPVMGVCVISALFANIIQTGWVFTTEKLKFDFSKLFSNVGQNLQKMFFSGETFFNLLKSVLKVFGVFGLAFFIVYSEYANLLLIPRISPAESIAMIAAMIFKFVSFTGLLLLIFAVGDYAFQRYQFTESLKMSRQELKEEYKELEGNPEVKQKLKQLRQEILSQSAMLEKVPTADVVVTNPTHFAVALKYDSLYMDGPMVVAKGQDEFAQRIKAEAKKNGVPVMENKPLARALFAKVPVGQEVPREFYEALKTVYVTLHKMKQTIVA